VNEAPVSPLEIERFEPLLGSDRYERFRGVMARAADSFRGRRLWNVNSSAEGGGVAEMLSSLLGYTAGAGIEARWLVIEGDDDFFDVTKRIHNRLHGEPGDEGELGERERRTYQGGLDAEGPAIAELIGSDDVVILHDPQTAGLVAAMRSAARAVIWRCHVGLDAPNDLARRAWDFLRPYVEEADAVVFSREAFEWEGLDHDHVAIIAPSIDAFSPKNQALGFTDIVAILRAAVLASGEGQGAPPAFERLDGSTALVERKAKVTEAQPLHLDTPLVTQVSRWDRLKDPLGVMQGFVDHVAPMTAAHLMLAGPAAAAVADDPEGLQVLADCVQSWEQLPEPARGRVHLAALPMTDSDENAAMVNALQRHATVVIQKSLAEGFGLTVAEAMWKGRPVVASRIGGIQEQIDDGRTGLLVNDPRDLADYGGKVRQLLEKPFWAAAIGAAARENVRDHFLAPRHLLQYAALLKTLVIRSAA
jgi:trehalose synthase